MIYHQFEHFLAEYEGRFEKEYGYAGGREGREIHGPVNIIHKSIYFLKRLGISLTSALGQEAKEDRFLSVSAAFRLLIRLR